MYKVKQAAYLFIYRTFGALFTFDPNIRINNLDNIYILFRNFNSFNFRIWVAVGVVVVHAGLSAASACPMVRKVWVTNGMQEFRTEEDSLELRQVGSW